MKIAIAGAGAMGSRLGIMLHQGGCNFNRSMARAH